MKHDFKMVVQEGTLNNVLTFYFDEDIMNDVEYCFGGKKYSQLLGQCRRVVEHYKHDFINVLPKRFDDGKIIDVATYGKVCYNIIGVPKIKRGPQNDLITFLKGINNMVSLTVTGELNIFKRKPFKQDDAPVAMIEYDDKFDIIIDKNEFYDLGILTNKVYSQDEMER